MGTDILFLSPHNCCHINRCHSTGTSSSSSKQDPRSANLRGNSEGESGLLCMVIGRFIAMFFAHCFEEDWRDVARRERKRMERWKGDTYVGQTRIAAERPSCTTSEQISRWYRQSLRVVYASGLRNSSVSCQQLAVPSLFCMPIS